MARIFISYSRRDQDFARRLATDLVGIGADVWIDVDDIPPGMDWSNAIQEGLDTCEVMLLVVSPASMESPNVQDEWKYFKDQGKPLFPVLASPAKMHFQLHRLQYIDFHQQPYTPAFQALCAAINDSGVRLTMPPDSAPDQSAPVLPGSRGITRVHWLTGTVVAALALLAVILALNGAFGDLLDQNPDAADEAAPTPTSDAAAQALAAPSDGARGVSVWYMSGDIDWQQVADAGYSFAVIRASESNTSVDRNLVANWQNAKDAGLLVTAYHVFDPKIPVEAQVEQFFGAMGEHFVDLPLVIDIERDSGVAPDVIAAAVQQFADAVENTTGRTPIILTYANFWNTQVSSAVDWSGYDLMVMSETGDPPTLPSAWAGWTFWLYEFEGAVPGIPETVPLIVYNGSVADLHVFAE